jgi:transcriptional regulator with XRE-family HTH domain
MRLSMKDKLKSYLEYLGLSAAQLADQIGVQRSSFSHILNGRNKPSADFINKLLASYPDLNANWLFGSSDSMLINQRAKSNVVRDLFSEIDTPANNTVLPTKTEAKNEPAKATPSPSVVISQPEPEIKQGKQIEKIIVLYSDKSFSEYKPGS